ncbi:methyltransferase domain-containing protein [Candidatus Entotheonella palauensis]|uniref:methyltransferase domain-containing protein n=1 Tax=Candidatus Entotheonella palauensis TaxID=93172 RepID=UPI000B7D56C1|nr:methyltransferase domain-containing protein [Candidatus Entotheonella palauensis]
MAQSVEKQTGFCLSERLATILACPDCRCGLDVDVSEAVLVCPTCERHYRTTPDGTPILFARDSEFSEREAAFCDTATGPQEVAPSKRLLSVRLLPRTTPYRLTKNAYDQAMQAIPEGMILNLGSGMRRPDRDPERWVNLDIRPSANCDIVSDAHWLPFRDNVLSSVVSANVFEYLRDPFQAAAEIKRALQPGGTVYLNVAFILPLSTPDYHDRFRFTRRGLLSLFGDLDILDIGPSSGPVMALSMVLDRLLDTAVPGRLPAYAIRWGTAWALQPLKYLDPWILRRDHQELSAAGFYLVARKPA